LKNIIKITRRVLKFRGGKDRANSFESGVQSREFFADDAGFKALIWQPLRRTLVRFDRYSATFWHVKCEK